MLSRLLNWLGFGPHEAPIRKPPRPGRPRSATAHLFDKRPAETRSKAPAKPAGDNDFNPYNTGKFDRSASWERISKKQR